MKELENWSQIPSAQYPILKKLNPTNRIWVKRNYRERIYTNSQRSMYFHKDPLHGEVEVYNKKGQHIDVYLPTGEKHPLKGADKKKSLKNFL